ncbi:GNAT family N-acetyltransferase [Collimonas sp. H4R21]|uniref:GNAT family N-acetyltransferase n=1 Tax=Collimonas rhizosphaerae TaxID=3126357 RepID=A0ABU9Q1A0_9BURK
MSARNLQYFFEPQSIAVIGASEKPKSIGTCVLRHIVRGGFKGQIFPVNPKYDLLDGIKTFRKLDQLPAAPELAVICTPAATVPRIIGQLGTLGSKAVIVMGEAAVSDGGLLQAALQAARPYLLRMIGPGSAGIMAPAVALNASLVAGGALPGRIALLAESGALACGMADWASSQGIGFSKVVALGGSADVDVGDMLDFLAGDAGTQAILLCVEHIPHARKFMSAARAAARNRPVLVLRSGLYGAVPDAIFDAAVRRAGMLRVFSTEDLFSAVETLSRIRPLDGRRLLVIGNGRGPGLMACDALVRSGGKPAMLSGETVGKLKLLLPAAGSNAVPVALPANASALLYGQVMEAVSAERGADALLVIHAPSALESCTEIANAIASVRTKSERNILSCWLGGASLDPARQICAAAGIPAYATPDSAVCGFMQMVDFRRNQNLLMQVPPSASAGFIVDRVAANGIVEVALRDSRQHLSAADTGTLLAAYGIAVKEAPQASDALPEATALTIGLAIDPVFGPAVVLRQSGKDGRTETSAGLPPLNLVLARDMAAHGGVAGLADDGLQQSAPGADQICQVLLKVSRLLTDIPELAELEIGFPSPGGQEMAGMYAHARVQPSEAGSGLQRLAICPYPDDLEEIVCWQGAPLLLRPIRPEDGEAHVAFFNALDPEDVRYRMFVGMRALQPSQLARFTQIDYDREMAFIATRPSGDGSAETLGVARVVADPDNIQAEFSVIVRSDLKALGLGQVLMTKLIAYCRSHGTREMIGEALPHNVRILHLVKKLGFEVKPLERSNTMWLRLDLRPGLQR